MEVHFILQCRTLLLLARIDGRRKTDQPTLELVLRDFGLVIFLSRLISYPHQQVILDNCRSSTYPKRVQNVR